MIRLLICLLLSAVPAMAAEYRSITILPDAPQGLTILPDAPQGTTVRENSTAADNIVDCGIFQYNYGHPASGPWTVESFTVDVDDSTKITVPAGSSMRLVMRYGFEQMAYPLGGMEPKASVRVAGLSPIPVTVVMLDADNAVFSLNLAPETTLPLAGKTGVLELSMPGDPGQWWMYSQSPITFPATVTPDAETSKLIFMGSR